METIIIHPKDKEQLSAFKNFFKTMNVPFEIKKKKEESPYDSEFVSEILQAREDSKNGIGTFIKTEDLWK